MARDTVPRMHGKPWTGEDIQKLKKLFVNMEYHVGACAFKLERKVSGVLEKLHQLGIITLPPHGRDDRAFWKSLDTKEWNLKSIRDFKESRSIEKASNTGFSEDPDRFDNFIQLLYSKRAVGHFMEDSFDCSFSVCVIPYQSSIARTYTGEVKDIETGITCGFEIYDGGNNSTEIIYFEKLYDEEKLTVDKESPSGIIHPVTPKGVGVSNIKDNLINQKEESKMRRLVKVQVIDDDKGLPVEFSLVAELEGLMAEDDNETVIRQAIMDAKSYDSDKRTMDEILVQHNEARNSVVNEDILNRTGNKVKLRAVKLKDLRFNVV